MNKIESFQGSYRFLSNFYYAPIEYREFKPESVEVAYQATKCTDYEDMIMILHMNSWSAKQAGKRVEIREDWDEIKVPAMEQLVFRKFETYSGLRQLLLGTYPSILEEGNTWGDTFWGVCDGVGENHLGRILMEIRSLLRGEV